MTASPRTPASASDAVVASASGAVITEHPAPGVARTVLPGGLRVITEHVAGVRSASVGLWIEVGSRDEKAWDPAAHGAAHYLEHLLFKGSDRRSARAIAQTVDAMGGEMNAYTSKEHTAYHLRVPATGVPVAVELLSDVLTSPALRPDDVTAERQVILEELLLSEDDAEDRVSTLCDELLFPGHPLGREVLGTPDTIEATGRDAIATFFDHWYQPANLVVAAAGDLDHGEVHRLVEAGFESRSGGVQPLRSEPPIKTGLAETVAKPTEQAHLAFGWRTCSLHDPARYPLAVLNHVLGGGLSSRLFHEIREVRGLAYSVGSYTSLYSDAGALVAAVGTSPSHLDEVRDLIEAEVANLVADGITDRELAVATGSLSGSLVLGLEDPASRMSRLGHGLISRDHVTPVDEHLARIAAVTQDDVAAVIADVLGSDPCVALVGPY